MPAAAKLVYSREEARRVVGISERRLRSWERQQLVPRMEEFAFNDLIALESLKKLHASKVSAERIRRTMRALREKLGVIENPLQELKIFCEGRKIAVVVDGQKIEPVSGQLLLDFDRQEVRSLLSFPQEQRVEARTKARQAEGWFEKGLELEQTGAPPEDIIAAYQSALTLDPGSAGAAVNLGTIYYHLKRWADAERCYNQALEIDPGYALAHFNLGNLFDEKGDADRAAFHYQSALRVNPNYADAHYNLALLCQSRGDVMKAVRHWKAYLKLDGGSTWAAIARRELGKLRKATVVPGAKGADTGA